MHGRQTLLPTPLYVFLSNRNFLPAVAAGALGVGDVAGGDSHGRQQQRRRTVATHCQVSETRKGGTSLGAQPGGTEKVIMVAGQRTICCYRINCVQLMSNISLLLLIDGLVLGPFRQGYPTGYLLLMSLPFMSPNF